MVPRGGCAQLIRALEEHFPNTTGTLECPFKLILDKFPREGLPAYRGSKRTVLPNRPVDAWRIEVKPCLACHDLAFDGQRNNGWPASPAGRCRGTGPLAVIGTASVGVAELQREQRVGGRSDDEQALH